ncbi:hypothetical protein ACE4ZV_26940, partial [Salmonella enterica]|uniref:hypothetical protein n=1 Tax=Salmonella enterica TaxID=28901 RepID=UPI003D2D5137
IAKAYNPFELIDSLYKDSIHADLDYGVLRSGDMNLTYAEENLENEQPESLVTSDKILITKEEFDAAFYDGKRGNELIDRY